MEGACTPADQGLRAIHLALSGMGHAQLVSPHEWPHVGHGITRRKPAHLSMKLVCCRGHSIAPSHHTPASHIYSLDGNPNPSGPNAGRGIHIQPPLTCPNGLPLGIQIYMNTFIAPCLHPSIHTCMFGCSGACMHPYGSPFPPLMRP